MSLSFYGKRPGPECDWITQFAIRDAGHWPYRRRARGYERLILDAMRGDRTLFTAADGIERLWAVSSSLLESPPPVRFYAPGSWDITPSISSLPPMPAAPLRTDLERTRTVSAARSLAFFGTCSSAHAPATRSGPRAVNA